jgi:isopenicillin N synthase-like dioxygenase
MILNFLLFVAVQNTVEATACNDVAKKLYDACTSVGFFFAKNIGISYIGSGSLFYSTIHSYSHLCE